MYRTAGLLLVISVGVLTCGFDCFAQETPQAFTGARILPIEGEPIDKGTLVVSGGVVTAIGPVGKIKIPATARRIDVAGKVIIPGLICTHSHIGGIGGAMDILAGTKRVIAAMEHTDKQGNPKIVNECSIPLTGIKCLNTIITDIAVIDVTEDGLTLLEHAPGFTAADVQSLTEPTLYISPDLREIEL